MQQHAFSSRRCKTRFGALKTQSPPQLISPKPEIQTNINLDYCQKKALTFPLLHPASDLLHPASDLLHPASDLLHPAFDLLLPVFALLHPAIAI